METDIRENARQERELLLELDRTAKDAQLGYIRHQTVTRAVLKVVPALFKRNAAIIAEATNGEEWEREEAHAADRYEESRTEPCEHITSITICDRCLEPLP